VEERLAQLERALEELRVQNQQLRSELNDLRERFELDSAAETTDSAETEGPATRRRRIWARWYVIAGIIFVVALPMVLTKLGHMDAISSTAIGFINAVVVYFIGPGAIRLLAEGLVRAIPGVLLGQTTRIAVDNMRKKRKAQ
jgi:hypothetical protein